MISWKHFMRHCNQLFKADLFSFFPGLSERKADLAMKRIRKRKHEPEEIYKVLKWLNNGKADHPCLDLYKESKQFNKWGFIFAITDRLP